MKCVISLLMLAGVIACSAGCSDKPTVIMPTATGQPKPIGESGGAGAAPGKKDNVVNEKVDAPGK